jgi:O-antigen ligase/cytochrome c-type biogenesis protein CcmH/NrfG
LGPINGLALVLVVTSATAVNGRLSLWGSYERGQGLVTLLTYLLLLLLAADQLRTVALARRLIMAMVATGVPLVGLSLLQIIGWDPFGLVSDARSPIYATLGRANFVGAYLAMLVPLTLALRLMSRQPRWRLGWSAMLGAELLVIGLTRTRSAWLATAVSLALFALLWWGPKFAPRRRKLAWGGIGLLFVSGPLAVMGLGGYRPDSTAARFAIWQGTLELIAERPLLGYGAEALAVIFPRVYPPELVYYQGRQFFVDRAHNLLLDWMVTAGLPGLLAYGLVLITGLVVIGRALRQSQSPFKRILLTAILAALLGQIANNLVSFEVTPTATAGWLLLGLGVALARPASPPINPIVGKRPGWRWVPVALLMGIIGAACWQFNGRPLLADIAARSAQRYGQQGDWASSMAAAERAVTYWPVEPTHHLRLSEAYRHRAATDPATARPWLSQAETALLTARQLRPNDPVMWLHTAQFYTDAAQRYGSHTRPLADEAYHRSLQLAPNHAVIYVAWGQAYLADNQPEAAAPLLRQAVRLDASHGAAYLALGATEMALGRPEVALADYLEAVRLQPESSQAYTWLADCYWRLNQPGAARLAIAEALRRDPHNAQAINIRQAIESAPSE